MGAEAWGDPGPGFAAVTALVIVVTSHSKGPWRAVQGLPHTILAQGHVSGHPAGSGQKENRHQLFDSLPVSDLGHFCSCVIDPSRAQGFTQLPGDAGASPELPRAETGLGVWLQL